MVVYIKKMEELRCDISVKFEIDDSLIVRS